MEKKLEKFQMSPSAMWLLFASISFGLLPRVAKAIVLYCTKKSLSEGVVLLCSVLSVVVGLLFLLIAVAVRFSKEERKGIIVRFGVGMLPAIFGYVLFMELTEKMYPWLVQVIPNAFVTTILVFLVSIICMIWIGGSVLAWIVSCMPKRPSNLIKHILTHPLCSIGIILLLALSNVLPSILSWMIEILPGTFSMSVMSIFVMYLILAVGQALCWEVVLNIGFISMKNVKQTEESTDKIKIYRNLRLDTIVFGVGTIVLLAIRGVIYFGTNPVTTVCDAIDSAIIDGGLELVEGDFEGALEYFEEAEVLIDAWLAVAEVTGTSSLGDIYLQNPENETVYYLYCVKNERIDLLEEYLRVTSFDKEFALALLDLYAKQDNLSDVQKIYRDEILMLCIETDTYRHTYLRPENIENHVEKLEQKLQAYGDVSHQVEMMELAISMTRDGKVKQETLNRVLQIGTQNQDDWVAQYLVAIAGSNLLYDGARHYEDTIKAAQRFEELYTEQVELSETELCGVQLKVSEMIIACYGYKEAIPYLEKAVELGAVEEAFAMSAQCYEALEQYDECYTLSKKLLETNPTRISAHYYAAISALKAGMVDEMIPHVVALAQETQNATKENYSADISLYAILQYMAFNDNSSWTDYRYAIYEKLTEEQRKMIEENSFLANYFDAVYECFGNKKSGHYEKALEYIDKVLEANENLPQALYLKGSILYGMKDFENAVEAYKKSLAIEENSATAWYALANAYDAMEEYELAYEACKRTMNLLPEQDHGSDWYGVSVHCQNLMNSLKSILGEEN